ncbi:carboxypeptidase-like regulatory domain-containing protein [Aquimarina rubra]|uniref:Carboxypeptidase-like regulatory domain-containing protein n=1 Tax=Aquimarina rubra TaxID=1920033 RepID=A0ABW5LHN9_9FLAO
MKINLFELLPWLKNSYGNTIFLMKLSFFFYLVFCFQLLSFNGFSQNSITLTEENSSLKSIIHKIEEQTSYRFILNNDVIDVDQHFSINVIEMEITETLTLLFKNAKISYKIKKNHIILSKAKKRPDDFTISGIVKDASTGETLLGASIIITNSNRGVVTNEYGFYSISLPKGVYVFEVSFLGYTTKEVVVQLENNMNMKIELQPSSSELDEIVITSNQNNKSQVKSILGGTTSLTTSEIKKLPSFFGEPDITRAILTQPGISSVGEGTSGFNVRGGNVDQNLILLDEAPLYNTSHLFGLFSIFNADAIKVIQLYKGEIPARFGGRASSLLEIRQKNGNLKRIKGEGGLGLLFSKFTIEGPIKKDKLSFLASGRRSYFDLFFPLFEDIRFKKFHFYDLNTKLTWNINENNTLYASGFFGADVIQFRQEDLNAPDVTADLGWTNTTATLRWNHIFSNKLFANITGIYSQYNYALGVEENLEEVEDVEGILSRSIENWIFKPDFTYYSGPTTKMRFGFSGNVYKFTPKLRGNALPQQSFDREKAVELAAYYSIEKQWNKFSLLTGLRASWFANFGEQAIPIYDSEFPETPSTIIGFRNFENNQISKSYFGLEPRISLKYELNDRKALKIGYHRMFQYVHLLSNQTVVLPNDVWKPAGVHIAPLEVNQFSAGFVYDTRDQNYNFSIEGYYKTFDNIIEYKNGARIGSLGFLGVVDNVETEVVPAKGYSYGLELAAYKNKGRLTGNVNYTYSVSKRKTISNFSSEQINDGAYFSSNFDRPHIFNMTANYKLSKKWDIGAFFTYQTGRPITPPNGRLTFDGDSFLTYADRNSFRIPNTHRADISFTYTPTGNPNTNWEGSWSFGVYNVYARKNAFSVNSFFSDRGLETEQISLIGAPIPFISYNFKF